MRSVRRADVVVAALLAVTGGVEVLITDDMAARSGRTVLLALVTASVMLLRTPMPITCLAITTCLVVLTYVPIAGLSLTGVLLVGCLLALASVGRHSAESLSRTALGATIVVFVLGAAFAGRPWDVVVALVACSATWGAGWRLRREAERSDELGRLAADLVVDREDRAREAVQAERARLARELHDTVAHTVSVMTLQVGGVRRQLEVNGGRARERDVLLDVEDLGRNAVAELHRLLDVLRTPGRNGADPADFSGPGIDDLPMLAARVRAAGVRVELEVRGERTELPTGVERTVYRTVQESLTNVLKHCPEATARVRLTFTPDVLDLDVDDDGPGAVDAEAEQDGLGLGLLGLRERIALYGGRFEAGPRPGRGFRVSVRLPLPTAESS